MACKYVKEFEFGSASKAKGKPYAEGGNVKADLKQDKKMVTAAVHKHEKAQHPGKPLTKMAMGGLTRDQVFAGLQQNKQAAGAASQRNMPPQAAAAAARAQAAGQRNTGPVTGLQALAAQNAARAQAASQRNMPPQAEQAAAKAQAEQAAAKAQAAGQRNMNQQHVGQQQSLSQVLQQSRGLPRNAAQVPPPPMKKGGKVSPAKKAMVKQEMMVTPTMRKEEMVQKRVVKGPAMSAGRDPRTPMIAMKCGGMYKKGK